MLTLGLRRRLSLTALTALLLFFSPLLMETALAASISVSPTQGPRGALVIVSGSEWRPGDLVILSWNFPPLATVATVQADGGGVFTTTVVVPEGAPIGPTQVNAINETGDLTWQASFKVFETEPVGCVDAYFIGAHGTTEGPDSPNQTLSKVIGETWENFRNLATNLGKNVRGYAIDYPAAGWQAPGSEFNAGQGSEKLKERVGKIQESCTFPQSPHIVLVGYSLGAWVINKWLSAPGNNALFWPLIDAVELYGDPLWRRKGNDYLTNSFKYKGVARGPLHLVPEPNPYDNSPQGPGGELSKRWQSRCLKGDPVCGEGHNGIVWSNQYGLVINCGLNPDCEHTKYTKDGGYNLTTRGANFLALKTFPSDSPKIEHVETFREGELVFFRLFFTDPSDKVKRFGFVGIKGSGWAWADFPLSDPGPYGRVSLEQRRIELPFNHLCNTGPAYESDVEVWISDSAGKPISSKEVHLACSAPCEVVTPYSNFTWSNTTNLNECRQGIAR